MSKTPFLRRYGLVDVSRDMMSLERSLARSGDRKQDKLDRVRPASYREVEDRSFLIMLVASIKTSVSWWKHWLAAR